MVIATGLVVLLRGWRRRLLAALPPDVPEEPGTGLKLVFAGLSPMFWPAGLAMSALLLSKPATVRAGVLCAYVPILNFSIAVITAIVIVTVGAVLMPELLFA